MRRLMVTMLAATIVASAVWAAAASMGVSSRKLGAGNASVTRCDADGIGMAYSFDASGNVVGVNLSNVAAACVGTTVKLNLTASNGQILASQSPANLTLALTNGATTVTTSPATDVSSIAKVNVVLEGV